MKRLEIILLGCIFFLIGCENMQNTPSKKVEDFFGKYQRMNMAVIEDLEKVMNNEEEMTKNQKGEYKALLEKQYQNLAYKIKSEEIENDTATVEVEIEVLDYKTAIEKASQYYQKHPDEFKEEKDYMDYKIKEMKTVTDKEKQDLTINLRKENGVWIIEELSEIDIQKIHGLY